MSSIPASMQRELERALTHRVGDALLDAGQISAAKTAYLREALKIVGPQFKLPATAGKGNGGVRSELYANIDPLDRTNLMGCLVGMAKCLWRENDLEMALAWCEESNCLHHCVFYSAPDPLHDWRTYTLPITELIYNRTAGLCLAADIFASLGNSGTAAARRWLGTHSSLHMPAVHKTPQIKNLLAYDKLFTLLNSRHPDPQASLTTKVTVPALQVRGSWTRLHVEQLGGPTDGRLNFSSFIWNSHYYVAGGTKSSLGPWYRDIWSLDLNKRDAWRRLPDYPTPRHVSDLFIGRNMLVYNDTAILFTGRPDVDVFDLKTETWSMFRTTYDPTPADIAAGVTERWPYPRKTLYDSTMQIVDDKLYVFGGSHGSTIMGCSLFMELDLRTRKWRRLSGTVRVTEHADHSCPGPRKSAASFVSPDKKRFFLLFGVFDRDEASRNNEPHGTDVNWACPDFWSWNIEEEAWRLERLSGNTPCARTEMAYTYNEKLQALVVFGGFHPSLPSHNLEPGTDKKRDLSFSYLADTFLYSTDPSSIVDPEPTRSAPKWKQVLTPGFPTYRCQAHAAYDPATGRTYMFGGYTNSQYIPTCSKLKSRSFGDLWELRVDAPGGHFDEVDVEEEVRIAKAGPWQRCFSCAAAGPWKKCGGSCKGRVFFCGSVCLREGWKEHKEMHQCRKL
ncbi:hypothetical protein C8F01DRAFT_1056747 [Mycena amicta]|nr:hypothetical protein C8F01DRAFT_1056747 [Mycena amicta]